MTVLTVDFGLRRLIAREASVLRGQIVETRDQIVRRTVIERCERMGGIPGHVAYYHANQAAQIVRTNPTRETSSVVENAVRQAIAASKPRNPDPNSPLAA